MAERSNLDIEKLFGDFHRAEAGAGSPIGGAAMARATATRRLRVRIALLSVMGTILFVVPIAALAAGRDGRNDEPITPATTSTAPSETPSPTESPTAPDGRLTVEQLTARPVDLPALAHKCPAGPYQMTKEETIGAKAQPWLIKVAHANLDDDSALETAALVQCTASELQEAGVVVFDVKANGTIVLLGLIVKGSLWDVFARPEGGVAVDISDIGACCPDRTPGVGAELHQQRFFAWESGSFRQVGGPTRFVPHSGRIDLRLTLKGYSWGPEYKEQAGGPAYRKATVRLQVTNLSSVASGQWVIMNDGDARGVSGVGVHQPGLPVGASAEITVELRQEATRDGSFPINVYELGSTEVGGDSNVDNNSVRIANPAGPR